MVLTSFVELDGAATFVFMSALGVLTCCTQLQRCSRTEAVAAVAASMSQDFAGYFSYKRRRGVTRCAQTTFSYKREREREVCYRGGQAIALERVTCPSFSSHIMRTR
jgi:hypothetical protein